MVRRSGCRHSSLVSNQHAMISAATSTSTSTAPALHESTEPNRMIAELLRVRPPFTDSSASVDSEREASSYRAEIVSCLLRADAADGCSTVEEAYEAGYGPDDIRNRVLQPALEAILSGIHFPRR